MALKFASGTARFITGKLATINKENIQIETPSATIGIRGTDFTVTVDELGRSLIILLPKEDGLSSGEIVVSTAAGQVVLNKPYEATTVELFESTPSKPVILDLTLDIIDNMLIVNPPKRDPNFVSEGEQTEGSDNILDVDYLEFDELETDYLAQDELEFSELDINYLDRRRYRREGYILWLRWYHSSQYIYYGFSHNLLPTGTRYSKVRLRYRQQLYSFNYTRW
jgi:hypothetical protein